MAYLHKKQQVGVNDAARVHSQEVYPPPKSK